MNIMERLKLSKTEKQILINIRDCNYPHEVKEDDYMPMRKLIFEGLVKCVESEYGQLIIPSLTNKGEIYFLDNPKLKNPSFLQDKAFILSVFASIISIISLIITIIK